MKQTEWEIVEQTSVSASAVPPFQQARPQWTQPGEAQFVMQSFFGRWWKWKAAVLVLLAACILIVVAAFTGMVFLLVASVAVLSLLTRKFRHWLGGSRQPH